MTNNAREEYSSTKGMWSSWTRHQWKSTISCLIILEIKISRIQGDSFCQWNKTTTKNNPPPLPATSSTRTKGWGFLTSNKHKMLLTLYLLSSTWSWSRQHVARLYQSHAQNITYEPTFPRISAAVDYIIYSPSASSLLTTENWWTCQFSRLWYSGERTVVNPVVTAWSMS